MEDVSVENVLDAATPFLKGRNEPETGVYETHCQGGVR